MTDISLNKARKILRTSYRWYRKKGDILPQPAYTAFENDLAACDKALLAGNREEASRLAQQLEKFTSVHFTKTWGQYAFELAFALILALAIALVVRTMWWEPYQIPTGSMRPTFKEQDHLTVTKTSFGINIPMETDHFYFDPKLIQRTGVVIWSGDNIPLDDTDTTFLGIFPYKKRFIKRLIGKPGDSLYFYGGKIYGVDSDGKAINELIDSPWMQKLEYVPFLRFEGKPSCSNPNTVQFEQMHQPIGRLTVLSDDRMKGDVFNGKEWIKDQPIAQRAPHDQLKTYSDWFGMRNFAMARLLTKKQLSQYENIPKKDLEEGILYLELIHTPSTSYPKPVIHRYEDCFEHVTMTPFATAIPLKREHLDAIMDSMYTARFVVKDGRAHRYSADSKRYSRYTPSFPGVPDGTYEFYYGKGKNVSWGGVTFDLPKDHPLYNHDPANVQRLFNYGIDMNTYFDPNAGNVANFPSRYAYFRDGDLYLLGAPIMKKDDPVLVAFNKREAEREQQSSSTKPYVAFRDFGPPVKEGKYDVDFIRAFGITIPPKNYLVLGDNHAMSSDSRVFGFVPQENLQGTPSLILWPPGSRWGIPAQKPYPVFVEPRLIVWGSLALLALLYYLFHRYRASRPIFKKIER
ncbi:MAG: signal peptidase I [Parachlamydia sp.]|nr:signal peptidase I [Parachlamydia sp.]